MDERHWCNIFNKHPRLATIDVNVRLDWVKVSPSEKYNTNNSIKALHIFSAKDKEDSCARAVGSIYNKIRTPWSMNRGLPEGRYFRFVPGSKGFQNGRQITAEGIDCL